MTEGKVSGRGRGQHQGCGRPAGWASAASEGSEQEAAGL